MIAMRPTLQTIAALALAGLLAPASARAAHKPAWAHPGWPHRLQLRFHGNPPAKTDIRTGSAEVILCGRSKPDGSDLRLADEGGKPVPFRIEFHDPLRRTLLSFEVRDPKQPLWLYFGNLKAKAIDTLAPGRKAAESQLRMRRWLQSLNGLTAGMQYFAARTAEGRLFRLPPPPGVPMVLPFAPKAGTVLAWPAATPPKLPPAPRTVVPPLARALPKTWRPDSGLLAKTFKKKNVNQHPKDLAEMRKMLAEGTELYGARYQRECYVSFNPFGPSDGYMTLIDGVIRIDKPGVYSFCTQSDEASFLLVDGKLVVGWPGRHTWGGSQYGEKNGEVALTQGRHRVTYYHEEGVGNQMAFFGWALPGARAWTKDMRYPHLAGLKHHAIIPVAQFPLPHKFTTRLVQREDAKPLVARFQIESRSSNWLRHVHRDTQAESIRFRDLSVSSAGKIVKRTWDFGDGIVVEGNVDRPEHIYLRLGRPVVKLTVTDEKGNTDTCRLSPYLFLIKVRYHSYTRGVFNYGRQEQYYPIAKKYIPAKLDTESLVTLFLFTYSEKDWPLMAEVGTVLFARTKDFPPADHYVYRMSLGRCYALRDVGRYKDALTMFQAAAAIKTAPVSEAQRTEAKLEAARVRHEFLGRHDLAVKAYEAIIAQYEKTKAGWLREPAKTAMIGIGDSLLTQGERAKAVDQYLTVRKLGGYDLKKGAQKEDIERGSFESNVWDHLDQNLLAEAHELLDRWERKYPWHKPEGLTFYLRAKIFFIQGQLQEAIALADRSVAQNPKADTALDCLWMKSNALQNLKQYDAAIEAYKTLLLLPGSQDFQEAATQRIKDCQKLKEATKPTDKK